MKRLLTSAALMVFAFVATNPIQASSPSGHHSGGGNSSYHGSGNSSYHGSSYNSYHGSSYNSYHNSSPSYYGHSSYGKGSYQTTYGKQFSHGYYYPGKDHNHWTYRCWSSRYGCQCYYCPYTYCWYYWYEPSSCYYPMNYASVAPPVVASTQAVSQAVSQSVVVNGPAAVMPPAGPDGPPLPPK